MGEVITITGHSDDVVNIEGNGSGMDEASEGATLLVLGSNDTGKNAGVRVTMRYGKTTGGSVWSAEVSPVKEDMPMLVALIKLDSNGYSPVVEVHGAVTILREHDGSDD